MGISNHFYFGPTIKYLGDLSMKHMPRVEMPKWTLPQESDPTEVTGKLRECRAVFDAFDGKFAYMFGQFWNCMNVSTRFCVTKPHLFNDRRKLEFMNMPVGDMACGIAHELGHAIYKTGCELAPISAGLKMKRFLKEQGIEATAYGFTPDDMREGVENYYKSL